MNELGDPFSVFVSNGEIYVPDMENHRVLKMLRNGQIVTICGTGVRGHDGDGQPATMAQIDAPTSVVVSSSNQVYISDGYNHCIRRIDHNGIISTVAGICENPGYNGDDQLAVNAQLNYPIGLFVTDDEEVLFCDCDNNRVRMIDRFGMIKTIAGTGGMAYNGDGQLATQTKVTAPISVFQYKNEIYICDCDGRIMKIDPNGIISTIAGTGVNGFNGDDQLAIKAQVNYPGSLFVVNDEIYFADTYNFRIRKIDCHGVIHTIAGNEGYDRDGMLAIHTKLRYPQHIFIDEELQVYFVDDNRIRKIDQNGIISTIISKTIDIVPFDFQKYPHIGPKKKQIKPFPPALYDLIVICMEM